MTGIRRTLLEDHRQWLQHAYDILDEISFRGNKVSEAMKLELQQLEDLLQSRASDVDSVAPVLDHGDHPVTQDFMGNPTRSPRAPLQCYEAPPLDPDSTVREDFALYERLTTAQLMDVANAVDTDSLDWFWASDLDFT